MTYPSEEYPQEYIVEFAIKGSTKVQLGQVIADDPEQAKDAIRALHRVNFFKDVYPAENSSIKEMEQLFEGLLDVNMGFDPLLRDLIGGY